MRHESEQADAQRRHEIAEERERWTREDNRRWVEERRQASLDLLSKLDPWIVHLRRWGHPWPQSTPEDLERERRELRQFDWQVVHEQVGDAWAVLELVGSDEVRQAYKALVAQMFATQATTYGPINQDALDRMVATVNQRHDELLARIRSDLGVSLPLTSDT